jgi:RHS repeat-associated protein
MRQFRRQKGFGEPAARIESASSYGPSWSTGAGWAPGSFTPTSPAWFDEKNRLVNPLLGIQYDAAGNLTAIGGFTFAYDAENRLVSSTLNSVTTNYVYDGEGRRVKKGSVVMVYDAFGRLAAEYGGTADPVGTEYLTTDHLGSTRLVTSSTGAERRCLDYLPFGEQMTQGMGTRGTCYASANEPRVKFTGKERDQETGMDYFGARYLSSAQGRFTTPDPLMASAKASDPQTWNRYSYAINNPLRHVDPDGLEVPEDCAKDKKCAIVVKVNVIYDQTANRGRGLTAEQKRKFEQGQLAKAQKDYGTSNIKLDFTYTAGSYTVGANGQPQLTGIKSDALNLVVSNATPNGAAGVSGVDRNTDVAVTFVNFNEVHDRNAYPLFTNTTEHEFGHQFLGDVYRPLPGGIAGFLQYLGREAVVDSRVAAQAAGVSQQGFREGLIPRRYAVPLDPEANKPRQ